MASIIRELNHIGWGMIPCFDGHRVINILEVYHEAVFSSPTGLDDDRFSNG